METFFTVLGVFEAVSILFEIIEAIETPPKKKRRKGGRA